MRICQICSQLSRNFRRLSTLHNRPADKVIRLNMLLIVTAICLNFQLSSSLSSVSFHVYSFNKQCPSKSLSNYSLLLNLCCYCCHASKFTSSSPLKPQLQCPPTNTHHITRHRLFKLRYLRQQESIFVRFRLPSYLSPPLHLAAHLLPPSRF
jgi:hypothetical protein